MPGSSPAGPSSQVALALLRVHSTCTGWRCSAATAAVQGEVRLLQHQSSRNRVSRRWHGSLVGPEEAGLISLGGGVGVRKVPSDDQSITPAGGDQSVLTQA